MPPSEREGDREAVEGECGSNLFLEFIAVQVKLRGKVGLKRLF